MEPFPAYEEGLAELPADDVPALPGPPRWETRLQQQSGNVYAPRFAGATAMASEPPYDPYRDPVYATHPLTSARAAQSTSSPADFITSPSTQVYAELPSSTPTHPQLDDDSAHVANNVAPSLNNTTYPAIAPSTAGALPMTHPTQAQDEPPKSTLTLQRFNHTSPDTTKNNSPAAKAIERGALKYKRSTTNLMKHVRRPTNKRSTNKSKESLNISSPYDVKHVRHASADASMLSIVNAANPGVFGNDPWTKAPEDLSQQAQTAERESRQYADGTPWKQRIRKHLRGNRRANRKYSIEEEFPDDETRMRINRERSLISLTWNEHVSNTPLKTGDTETFEIASTVQQAINDASANADLTSPTPAYKGKGRAGSIETPLNSKTQLTTIAKNEDDDEIKVSEGGFIKRPASMGPALPEKNPVRFERPSKQDAGVEPTYVGSAGPDDRVGCCAPLPRQWSARHDRVMCFFDVRQHSLGSCISKLRNTFEELQGVELTEGMIDLRLRQLDDNIECTYFRDALARK